MVEVKEKYLYAYGCGIQHSSGYCVKNRFLEFVANRQLSLVEFIPNFRASE